MGGFSIIDTAIVVIYLIVCISLGMFHRRRITSIREFAIGKGSITTMALVATIYGTGIDSSSSMGVMEKIHSMGLIFGFIVIVCEVSLWLITFSIFTHDGFAKFKNCMSLSGIMYKISGPTGSWTSSIGSLCFAIGAVAIQTLALGQITHYLFGIEEIYGMVVGIGIITLYSSFGGMKAVVITDMLQYWVFMVGIPLAAAMEFGHICGTIGLNDALALLPIEKKDFSANIEILSMMIIFILPATNYAFVQRYLMANSRKQLIDVFWKIIGIDFFFVFCLCLCGFVVLVKAPNIDSNDAFMYFLDHTTMVGLKGLIFAGLLAMIMSTADSWLQSAGVIVGHDILKTLLPKITEKQQIVAARVTIVLGGVSAILIATQMTTIIDGVFMIYNFWDPLITVPLCSAIMGFKSERMSYKVATATALIGVGIGHYVDGQFGAISVLTGLIGNAIGLFGTHYICGFNKKDYKDKEEQLAEELSA